MDIIKAMNLKKYYTSDTYEVRALDGVSLTVEDTNLAEYNPVLSWDIPLPSSLPFKSFPIF